MPVQDVAAAALVSERVEMKSEYSYEQT